MRLSVLCLALAGCASTGLPTVVTVRVPVPVACVPKDFPAPPIYPDTLEALIAADGPTQFELLAEGWRLKVERLKLLEATVAVCR